MTAAQTPTDRRILKDLGRFRALWSLAWPTVLSRAGILVMAMVDIVMVGQYSTEELAFASIGMSLFVPILVAGVGLLLGVLTLTAQAFGRGDKTECGRVFLRGLPWALTLGLAGSLLCAMSETWLTLLGQSPDLAEGGGAVARAVAIGVLAQLVYMVCAFHLEGTRRPRPALVAMLAANLLNVALNWILIYGHLGAPELGAVGSALGTAAIRIFLMIALLAYILTRPEARGYGLDRKSLFKWRDFWGPGGWRAGGEMRRLGWATGASVTCESSAYAMIMQFAGWIGPGVLAAYAAAYNLEALCFMIALGLGTAAAVTVGGALGRGDLFEADEAAWTGVAAAAGLMSLLAVAIWVFREPVARMYTSDPDVAAQVARLLPYIGGVVLLDGAQLVMAQCVRALGDAWSATRRFAIAFWAVMVPLAYFWGVLLGLGAKGLLIGVMFGCAASFLMQLQRFQQLMRQKMARRGLPAPESVLPEASAVEIRA